jgi:hypothetical protein
MALIALCGGPENSWRQCGGRCPPYTAFSNRRVAGDPVAGPRNAATSAFEKYRPFRSDPECRPHRGAGPCLSHVDLVAGTLNAIPVKNRPGGGLGADTTSLLQAPSPLAQDGILDTTF